MRNGLLLILFLIVVPAFVAGPAIAKEIRVAVLEFDPNLHDAVSIALSPWGLHVVSLPGPTPRTDVQGAAEHARGLAREHDAAVVLWIVAPAGAPPSLWMYDAQTEQLTVRPLSQPPPFDAATAAALALTIKTLLRTTAAVPLQERTSAAPPPGASAAESPSSPPPPSPSALAPPPGEQARGAATTAAPALAPPPPTHAWRFHSVALGVGPTGASATLAVRAGIGGSWWPPAWRERFGFGVDLRAGPNIDVAAPSFAGTFGDIVVGASARARLGSAALSLELGAGPTLHFTSLSATSGTSDRGASVQRADPALDVEGALDVALGTRARIGPVVGAGFLLRHQVYSLDADVVLRMPSVVFDFGGRVSVALD